MAIKKPSKRRRTAAELAADRRQAALAEEGPPMQPLRAGLPSTPLDSLHNLLLAVICLAVQERDPEYLMSPTFMHHLLYLGLDVDTAFRVKVHVLLGDMAHPRAFHNTDFHAKRTTPPGDFGIETPVMWDSWGRA